MGLMDYMEDLYASLTWREVEAEAPESGMCDAHPLRTHCDLNSSV